MDGSFGTNLAGNSTQYADMTEFGLSENTMGSLRSGAGEGQTLINGGSEQFNMLAEQDRMFAPANYDPSGITQGSEQWNMLAEQDRGIGGTLLNPLAPETRQALGESVSGTGGTTGGGGFGKAASSLLRGIGQVQQAPGMVMPQVGGYDGNEVNSLSSAGSGFGGLGTSFYAQNLTGVMPTERFAEDAFNKMSLLSRTG
jgi:hypothetical protein